MASTCRWTTATQRESSCRHCPVCITPSGSVPLTSRPTDMSVILARFKRFYGSHPLHLLTMVAGFSLAGYILFTFNPKALWNQHAWWQSIAVWLVAAVIFHDLALFPLYALADRLLGIAAGRRRRRGGRLRVPGRNHVRIPALASGLTLLMFWPGIVKQGSATYLAATGQSQQPFLGRWLLLTAVLFSASAFGYAVRLVLAHRRVQDFTNQADQGTDQPADTLSPRQRCTQPSDETAATRSSHDD